MDCIREYNYAVRKTVGAGEGERGREREREREREQNTSQGLFCSGTAWPSKRGKDGEKEREMKKKDVGRTVVEKSVRKREATTGDKD